jgi:hypothetical protein
LQQILQRFDALERQLLQNAERLGVLERGFWGYVDDTTHTIVKGMVQTFADFIETQKQNEVTRAQEEQAKVRARLEQQARMAKIQSAAWWAARGIGMLVLSRVFHLQISLDQIAHILGYH